MITGRHDICVNQLKNSRYMLKRSLAKYKNSHLSLSISLPAHIVDNDTLMDMIRIRPLPSLKCGENTLHS